MQLFDDRGAEIYSAFVAAAGQYELSVVSDKRYMEFVHSKGEIELYYVERSTTTKRGKTTLNEVKISIGTFVFIGKKVDNGNSGLIYVKGPHGRKIELSLAGTSGKLVIPRQTSNLFISLSKGGKKPSFNDV